MDLISKRRVHSALFLVVAAAVAGCSGEHGAATSSSASDPAVVPATYNGAPLGLMRASLRTSGDGQQTQCGPTFDARARQALTDMAQKIAGAQIIAFSAATTTEDVSSQLQKLQFDTSIRGIIKRPNLAFVQKAGAENTTLWFDGSTLTVLDRTANTFIRVSLKGDIDALLQKLDELQIEAPFGGLFSSDLEKKVTDYVYQADYYAPALLGDKLAHHIALRQENVDWQVWIDKETSLPKKAVITSKMLAAAPEHQLLVKEIKLDGEVQQQVDQSQFQAQVPQGAQEVQPSQQAQ